MAVSNAFVWGSGGAKLTPEQIAKQREIEDALLQKGVDVSPVGDWTQGLARVANAAAGSFRRGRLAKAEKENIDLNAAKRAEIAGILSGGGSSAATPSSGTATAIPMTSAAGEVSATSPVTGDTFAPFMDTIKAGGVQNPYALAAIAATGRAESGWSADNANRTWSDPSESGKPGTAGGIMSWRGPRYQALAATGDLSPQGQAKFFLQEDPQLIQRLNNAKSVEEAQQMMNQAWAFAGYNRPGGESARRLGYAKGYLSGFQGSGTEVASLDPSAGMSASQAIDAAAPASGYVDPMVSVQPRAAALPAPTTVSAQPAVAQPQQVAQATAPNGQQIPPAIMEVLSDPRYDARTRGIAEILLKQNMARQQAAEELRLKQSDPSYQLEQEYRRAQLEALRAKPEDPWEKLDDGRLYRKRTGEIKEVVADSGGNGQFRFKGNGIEGQALNGLMDAGKLTAEQAQQMAAGKTVTGPNGEIIFMTPDGIFGRNADGSTSQLAAPTPPQPPAAPQAPANGVDIFGTQVPPTPPVPPAPPQAPQQPGLRDGMIPLTPPKPDKPTEAQRNRVGNVNQAFDAITGELDRYADLVDKTGIEAMPGKDKDNLNTVRQGVMLQMKELFNLGVLNGPDLSLMEKMIYDPVIDPMKEGGLMNVPGQIWAGATGTAGDRAKNSVTELKRMLENIKNSVGKNSRPTGTGAPGGGADYKNRYGLE